MSNARTYCQRQWQMTVGVWTYTASAQIFSVDNCDPYFTIACSSVHVDGGEPDFNYTSELLAEHFPQLVEFEKWTGFTVDSMPANYYANALAYAGLSKHARRLENIEQLKNTIVYGAVDGDAEFNIYALMYSAFGGEREGKKFILLTDWLERRLPALRCVFDHAMYALYGEDYEKGVAQHDTFDRKIVMAEYGDEFKRKTITLFLWNTNHTRVAKVDMIAPPQEWDNDRFYLAKDHTWINDEIDIHVAAEMEYGGPCPFLPAGRCFVDGRHRNLAKALSLKGVEGVWKLMAEVLKD